MNSKTLVNALKVAVREVIKEELTDILREGLQSTVNELTTESKEIKPFLPKRKPKKSVMYTKNNKINDALNDTTVESEGGVPSYSELMKEGMPDMTFNSNDAQGFGMMRNGSAGQTQVMQDPETGRNMEIDPIIANAITKDYSSLMKAIDQKKGR
jgi:hypothetical protein